MYGLIFGAQNIIHVLKKMLINKTIDLSVILPVYNGGKYLADAIESILIQTYSNFELIIINDGSSDSSADVISSFTDFRIRYYKQTNIGLAETLNRGIELAEGKYIARMDQDDISFPDRFNKQIEFFESHPDHAMVGTWCEIWEIDKKVDRFHKHPTENVILQFKLLFNNPFVHSSMMIRKSCLDLIGGYSTTPDRSPPEDYELWSRVARVYQVANIPQILHAYREVPNSMSRDGVDPFLAKIVKLSAENIHHWVNDRFSFDDCSTLSKLLHSINSCEILDCKIPVYEQILLAVVYNIENAYDEFEHCLLDEVKKILKTITLKNMQQNQPLRYIIFRILNKMRIILT